MARIEAGILSQVSGTIGNVVGSSRNGKNYLRLKAAKVSNPQTEGQMAQRAKFGMVMQFMKPLTDVTKIGFQNNLSGKAPYNYACSVAMQQAVTGAYPNQEIDYASVLISEGDLCQMLNLKAEIVSGVMKFTWTHEGSARFGGWAETDKALLVVYNQTKKQVGYAFGESTRVDCSGEIVLPSYFVGDTLLVYVAFVAADGSAVSTSQFAGSFVMSDGQ